MTATKTADIIDVLAGVIPGSALDVLRDDRPQARENAQRSFTVLFEPQEPGTFPVAERYAVATFVARLLGFGGEFYGDLLGDEAPELVGPLAVAAQDAADSGPYGVYREPGLAAENAPGRVWAPKPELIEPRLAAALAHAHLLVYRLRESDAADLRKLLAAGWSADDIVTLSQLISFLNFQLRFARGLQALSENPAASEGA